MWNAKSAAYGFAGVVVAACTGICFLLHRFLEPTNLAMVYLVGTLVVAARGRYGPAAATAAAGVLAFDFFFIPPRFSLTVSQVQYVWTFAVMFSTAMVISYLTIRVREQARLAEEAAERNVRLFEKAKQAEIEMEGERLRSSLLSAVSHDLRTPLTAILGSAGALLDRGAAMKPAESRELLENIQAEGERLAGLIQNVLEVTRLESGPVQLRKELYPLEEIVGSALGRLEKSLAGREIAVQIPEEFPLVPADAVLLEQVFVNLLENGIRHTPPGGRLEISAETKNGKAVTSVTDHGPGLKPDELQRVFDKFYHGELSPGAGLGLAICRAIVVAHGGEIWADNRPEGGAAFRFSLPLGGVDGK